MEAYLGAPESYDSVDIEGTPTLAMKIAGGVHGDVATASITVNSIPKVIDAAPGLHTMRTLPIPSWATGSQIDGDECRYSVQRCGPVRREWCRVRQARLHGASRPGTSLDRRAWHKPAALPPHSATVNCTWQFHVSPSVADSPSGGVWPPDGP